MTKIEKIQDLLDGVEQDIRKATVRDILIELADFAKSCPTEERAGFKAAIEVIKNNFSA